MYKFKVRIAWRRRENLSVSNMYDTSQLPAAKSCRLRQTPMEMSTLFGGICMHHLVDHHKNRVQVVCWSTYAMRVNLFLDETTHFRCKERTHGSDQSHYYQVSVFCLSLFSLAVAFHPKNTRSPTA